MQPEKLVSNLIDRSCSPLKFVCQVTILHQYVQVPFKIMVPLLKCQILWFRQTKLSLLFSNKRKIIAFLISGWTKQPFSVQTALFFFNAQTNLLSDLLSLSSSYFCTDGTTTINTEQGSNRKDADSYVILSSSSSCFGDRKWGML